MSDVLNRPQHDLAPNLAQDVAASFTIQNALLDEIDPNPFRDLKNAPLMETKVDALADYYTQHGAFPTAPVARQDGNRLQLAYGHSTLEAAKRLGLPSINVEVRELSDKQMIGLMPTEHGENGKRDFYICLVAWMAALKEAKTDEERTPTALARQFGWVRHDPRRPDSQPRMNATAMACASCAEVILARQARAEWFKDSPCGRAHVEANRIKKNAEAGGFFSPWRDPDKSAKKLGFKEVKVDTLRPLHNLKRPLQFERNFDMKVVVPSHADLITHIDRLFSKNNPQDEIMNNILDFSESRYHLDRENRKDMCNQLNDAFDRLVLRVLARRFDHEEADDASE